MGSRLVSQRVGHLAQEFAEIDRAPEQVASIEEMPNARHDRAGATRFLFDVL